MIAASEVTRCGGRRHFRPEGEAHCQHRIGCQQYAEFLAHTDHVGVPVALNLLDDTGNCHHRKPIEGAAP